MTDMNNSALLLKNSLLRFYKIKENFDKLLAVLNKKTVYSLRILEWFCTNYSKKNNIIYNLPRIKKDFNVYLSYKNQLDSWAKLKFDPFKRDHKGFGKFKIFYGKEDQSFIETTVGQLNFFRWCIENRILEYVEKHYQAIKTDMDTSTNYASSKKKVKVKSVSAKDKLINSKEKPVKPKTVKTVKSVKESKVEEKSLESRKKRQPLSVAASRNCVKKNEKVILTF